MGKLSRDKGARIEREIVKVFERYGYEARRTAPMQANGANPEGDIEADTWGRGEVKARKNGFVQIYRWLTGNEFLILRADNKPPLIVMELTEALARDLGADIPPEDTPDELQPGRAA